MASTNVTTNLGLPQFTSSDIPSWNDINTAFALIDNLVGAIAPKYDATSTYSEGAIVQHEGGLYKAKADISTAEEWTASHWDSFILSQHLENTDLTNFVKVDLTNGAGITSNQYSHLTVVS